MTAPDIIFPIAGLASAAAAILAVTRRNPLYAVVWLLVTLVGMAVIFYLLAAPFLAMMQVVVYIGAILVLFVFVIMLLNLREEDLRPEAPLRERVAATVVAGALLALLVAAIWRPGPVAAPGAAGASVAVAASDARPGGPAADPEAGSTILPAVRRPAGFGTIEGVGRSLFGRYVLPFELISVLIVVAIVATVMLAKKKL